MSILEATAVPFNPDTSVDRAAITELTEVFARQQAAFAANRFPSVAER